MDFDLSVIKNANRTPKDISDILRILQCTVDHELTKRHISSQIDLALGFKIKQIEEILQVKARILAPEKQFDQWGPTLHRGAQTWVGLDFQILQTTYHDLKTLFDLIKPGASEKIVDLGAGYGRIGVFLHHFYPKAEFTGIELVEERVNEGNRILKNLNSINKKLMALDLNEIETLPEGDIFFIYDFGSESHIRKILEMLKNTPKRLLIVKGRIARQMMLKDAFYGEGIKVKKLEDIFIY